LLLNDNFAEIGGSVINNDSIDGKLVTTSNTDVTPVSTPQLSIDSDGNFNCFSRNYSWYIFDKHIQCVKQGLLLQIVTATATVIVSDNDSDGVYDSADLDDDNDGI
jgi:hypothetical protein